MAGVRNVRSVIYDLCSLQLSSRASLTRKLYQKKVIGTVERCQSECASRIRPNGGKSYNSSAVAAIVSKTNRPAFVTKRGRYDLDRDGNLRMMLMEVGREYRVHIILCMRPIVTLNAML